MTARKARVEGAASKAADPAPGNNGDALDRLVEYFKAEYPEEWEAAKLGPLEYGLKSMIETLGK